MEMIQVRTKGRIATQLKINIVDRLVCDNHGEEGMEPTFIATPYVQASPPSSLKVRALLNQEDAEYLARRLERKPIRYEFASAKLNSPIKIRTNDRCAVLKPLTDQTNGDKNTKRTRTVSAHSDPTIMFAQLPSRRSASTSSLPPIVHPLNTNSSGHSLRSSHEQQLRTKESAGSALKTGILCTHLQPSVIKKNLQEYLYDFHSCQVFSFAEPLSIKNDEKREKLSEHPDEIENNVICNNPMTSRNNRSDTTEPLPPSNSSQEPLPEEYMMEGLVFLSSKHYDEIFEYDWNVNEVATLVHDGVDRKRIYLVLKKAYRMLLWFFRFYAGKSALTARTVDLYTIPSKAKLLDDLNVQSVDPLKFGITETPLRREALIGFLLSVAKMNCMHSPNPASVRVQTAEGIEMSEAVKALLYNHFNVYAQVQDVNHFRFLFLNESSTDPLSSAQPRRLREIIVQYKPLLSTFFTEQIRCHHRSNSVQQSLDGTLQHRSLMTFAQFLSTLRFINLFSPVNPSNSISTAINTPGGNSASTGLDESRALRIFLSCLSMSAVDSAGRDGAKSTREASLEQFVEALLRVTLLWKETTICGGKYDVCPGQLTSDLCQCKASTVNYNFHMFDDAVEELFELIRTYRLKHARKRVSVKIASLPSNWYASKSLSEEPDVQATLAQDE